MQKAIYLLADSANGRYIPRSFVMDYFGENIDSESLQRWGMTEENRESWEDAANPESENYQHAWHYVLNNAEFTDRDGNKFRLHHDGDLWAICYELMTEEEKKNFGLND